MQHDAMSDLHDRSFLSDLVGEIHQSIPKLSIGADVIVGFPGETEERFGHTYELIASLPFSYLHVSPFSKRKGTPAAKFIQEVDEGRSKDRAEMIRELGRQKRQAFYRQFLQQELNVLVEDRRDKGTGEWKGFSRNYIPVLLRKEGKIEDYFDWINQEWRVIVTELAENGVVGRVVGR